MTTELKFFIEEITVSSSYQLTLVRQSGIWHVCKYSPNLIRKRENELCNVVQKPRC